MAYESFERLLSVRRSVRKDKIDEQSNAYLLFVLREESPVCLELNKVPSGLGCPCFEACLPA